VVRNAEPLAQLFRLARFRAQHPRVIITQHASFGYWQAWIPASNGGSVFTRYILSDLLDTLDELAASERGRGAGDPGAATPGLPHGRDHQGDAR
jgi:hypothetical protein